MFALSPTGRSAQQQARENSLRNIAATADRLGIAAFLRTPGLKLGRLVWAVPDGSNSLYDKQGICPLHRPHSENLLSFYYSVL